MTQSSKKIVWIVYQSAGFAPTLGMEMGRFPFKGKARKLADRLNESEIGRTSNRYSVRPIETD